MLERYFRDRFSLFPIAGYDLFPQPIAPDDDVVPLFLFPLEHDDRDLVVPVVDTVLRDVLFPIARDKRSRIVDDVVAVDPFGVAASFAAVAANSVVANFVAGSAVAVVDAGAFAVVVDESADFDVAANSWPFAHVRFADGNECRDAQRHDQLVWLR